MRSLFLLLVLALAPYARAAEFDVRPVPGWVDQLWAPAPAGAQLSSRSGVAGILTDHQVRVAGATVDEYFRRVRRVVSTAGVQNASELSIDFDPSYQRLVVHDIVLVRNAKRINELDPGGVRIIQKEPESEEKIYDGQLTALVFLKDVRAGDVIDYSYSLDGSNPLLGGRYADEYDFAASVPTSIMRHRLVWPAARPLHVRDVAQTFPSAPRPAAQTGMNEPQQRVEHRGNVDVYTWQRANVDAIELEDSAPDWHDPYETIQVTEYGSWNEVAQWAAGLFKPDLESAGAVATAADRIRAEHTSHDAQVIAAIHFVQDDIRYLGMEMGRGSHEPRQPHATLEQRYGDCKDKAFLLAMLLADLGLEAHPALVNTKLRRRLDDYLPSPFLFDHVITRVVEGERTYWIDGTIADQGGTLATIDTPNDERALVVSVATRALTPIAMKSRAGTDIDEVYSARGGATTLEVTSTYRGRDADTLRADLSSMSATDYAKERINLFAADHPRIEHAAGPTVSDNRGRNVIVVRERYVVRRLWKDGSWTYVPRAIEERLARPDTLIRSMPLAIDFPLDITERVTVRGAARVGSDDTVTDTPALHFEQRVDDGVVTYALRSKKDSVAVRDVADHIAMLNSIDEGLAFTFEAPHAAVWPWIAAFAMVVLFVATATTIAVRHRDASPVASFPSPVVEPVDATARVSGITSQ